MSVLLEAIHVKKYFPIYGGIIPRVVNYVRAVDDVTLSIRGGEVVALVGESGAGKSTFGNIVIGLMKPDEGRVLFEGRDIYRLKGPIKKEVRHNLQIVFQNPDSSLNPRMQVASILSEAIKEMNPELSKYEVIEEVLKLLESVGLNPDHAYKYPHELSGGEKQRVAIARVVAMKPKLIVADEPVSSLDVSVRSQILNLLMDIQAKLNAAILFISHDLGVVWSISDRVAVMYLGRIVEIADTEELFNYPSHPYTAILLNSAPLLTNMKKVRSEYLKPIGEPPSPINPPSGCRFHTRCPLAKEICRREEPSFKEVSNGHYSACHFIDKAPFT